MFPICYKSRLTHKIHTGSVRKLAFHEKLGVFPALSLQLHLFLVHRLETGRQLGLRLVPVEGPRRVLPFPWLLRILLLIVSSGVLRGRSESRIIEIVFLRSLATLVEWVLAYRRKHHGVVKENYASGFRYLVGYSTYDLSSCLAVA